jgi:hypothetical protein
VGSEGVGMKRWIILLVLVFLGKMLIDQSNVLAEQAYVHVINHGLSTAPEFIVITANNSKTGQAREICLEVTSFYWGLMKETPGKDDKELKQYMFSKSGERVFNFENADALQQINFDNYHLKNENVIKLIIIDNHLADSLKKLVRFREILGKERNDYYRKRQDILKQMADSIKTKRSLSVEENKMISDLPDRYYDDYYSKPIYNKYRNVSEQGENFMKTWNLKILKYKIKILKVEAESKRMNYKFFQQYYDIYGISFCHVAFKFGIITYLGDELAVVGFGTVI